MKKWILAAALALFAFPASAAVVESTETDDVLDAVDEVTGSLTVANRGTTVSVFCNGTYSADAWLQREVGSPGSGSWENVVEVTGADNATVTTQHVTEGDNESYRVRMSAFTSGDVLCQVTDQQTTPQTFAEGKSYVRHYDDFFTNTATINAAFYVTAENDASGTVCVVTPTVQEGAVTCVSGTGDDGADEVAFSLIDLTDDGALVSDGWMAVEVSLQVDQVDGEVGVCLHDEEATSSQVSPFDVDSNVVTFDTSNQDNSVCIMQQGEADDTDGWQAVSANADTEGNNSDEMEIGTLTAATYFDLRIELDSTGDGYFYIDDILVYAENEVVATTARLIPFVWVNTTAASPGATTAIIDFLEFVMARPDS